MSDQQDELSAAAERDLVRLVTEPKTYELILLRSKVKSKFGQPITVPDIKIVCYALIALARENAEDECDE